MMVSKTTPRKKKTRTKSRPVKEELTPVSRETILEEALWNADDGLAELSDRVEGIVGLSIFEIESEVWSITAFIRKLQKDIAHAREDR